MLWRSQSMPEASRSQDYVLRIYNVCVNLWFYARSQNRGKRLLASSRHVCISARRHGTPRLTAEGFSRNLLFEYFSKICRDNSCLFYVCVTVRHWYNNINQPTRCENNRFYWYLQSAQHVSGDNFPHPQEHWTVFAACGIMHRRCCL